MLIAPFQIVSELAVISVNFPLTYQLQLLLQLIRLKDMVIMQLEFFILFNFLFCIPHDRKRQLYKTSSESSDTSSSPSDSSPER